MRTGNLGWHHSPNGYQNAVDKVNAMNSDPGRRGMAPIPMPNSGAVGGVTDFTGQETMTARNGEQLEASGNPFSRLRRRKLATKANY